MELLWRRHPGNLELLPREVELWLVVGVALEHARWRAALTLGKLEHRLLHHDELLLYGCLPLVSNALRFSLHGVN